MIEGEQTYQSLDKDELISLLLKRDLEIARLKADVGNNSRESGGNAAEMQSA